MFRIQDDQVTGSLAENVFHRVPLQKRGPEASLAGAHDDQVVALGGGFNGDASSDRAGNDAAFEFHFVPAQGLDQLGDIVRQPRLPFPRRQVNRPVEESRHRPGSVEQEHLGMERPERLLSLLADRGRSPSLPTLRRIIEFSSAFGYGILEAQALRAQGVAAADASTLAQAIALFEQADAVPYAARARIERARLTADQDELSAGTGVLETLGDFDYLSRAERYVRRPS